MASAGGRGGPRSKQIGARADGAVAIDAVNFHGGAGLAINFSVAVIVLAEVAIAALHSLFQVDVREMNGFAEFFWIVERNLLVVFVEPIAFTVVRIHAAIDPAVSVKIGELGGLKLLVEFRTAGLFQKFFVAPQSSRRGGFWIFQRGLVTVLFGRIFLFRRVHFFAINFVVPPGQSEIGGQHIRAGVHVADHALAGGNRAGKNVFNRMAGLSLVDGRVAAGADAGVAEGTVRRRMQRIAIVRVNDVARRAPAGAIVAGMVVGSWQRHHRIDQPRFL